MMQLAWSGCFVYIHIKCLAQFWSVQLNVLTLQCCLLHPSHQQVSLPVHQLHYLTSQFAVMLLVGGKGGEG